MQFSTVIRFPSYPPRPYSVRALSLSLSVAAGCVVINWAISYKFDLRVYVLVASLNPLEAYVCKEGLGRLSTKQYQPPNKGNVGVSTMHLTNYSLNKRSEDFVHGEEGNKRLLSAVLDTIAEKEASNGGSFNAESVWAGILSLVGETLRAIRPVLLDAAEDAAMIIEGDSLKGRRSLAEGMGSGRCFQILGFDIMLDRQGRPHLIEVNNSPSMNAEEVLPLASLKTKEKTEIKAEGAKPASSSTSLPAPLHPKKSSENPPASSPDLASSRPWYMEDHGVGPRCECKECLGWHVHRICPVDVTAKRRAMTGALGCVLNRCRAISNKSGKKANGSRILGEAVEKYYYRVDEDRRAEALSITPGSIDGGCAYSASSALELVRQLFEHVAGRHRALNAFKFRKALQLAGILASRRTSTRGGRKEGKVAGNDHVGRNETARNQPEKAPEPAPNDADMISSKLVLLHPDDVDAMFKRARMKSASGYVQFPEFTDLIITAIEQACRDFKKASERDAARRACFDGIKAAIHL
mmetsp:Transcript_3104/g.4768  ORF Transcript_3104/g.4768 Transcript_3104/m.4768 type:complete len:524 (+) Transcript_3104:62-1633(+)